MIAGDATTGRFAVPVALVPPFERVAPELLDRLRETRGLTATASDVLDELGLRLAVPASALPRRTGAGGPAVAGHAITLRYLPERADPAHTRLAGPGGGESKLAHHTANAVASPGDILVVEACGAPLASTLGGMAATAALAAGLGGCVIDGAIRDVDEIAAAGLPVWSRDVTPVTGKFRLEAAALNAPVCCGGVQVRPGDLVLADDTGICFVAPEHAQELIARVLDISREEHALLKGTDHQ